MQEITELKTPAAQPSEAAGAERERGENWKKNAKAWWKTAREWSRIHGRRAAHRLHNVVAGNRATGPISFLAGSAAVGVAMTLLALYSPSYAVTVNGETVYPYEAGKLAYYRTGDLCSTVNGTVISSDLVDYLQVKEGQVLVRIDGEDSESEIFSVQQSLEEAQKTLETAQKNLDNCNAVAPIDGTIIGLGIQAGQEIEANTTVLTIADTSTIVVDATVDERNVSYVKPGMMVTIDQWGTQFTGVVESVSLNSKAENGVASYPITISADNTEGTLQVNSYVNYEIQASQNDNCLMAPIQAVRTVGLDDGSTATVVYVQADSQPDNALELPYQDEEIPAGFYPVQVEIGIQDTYNVEIKSGLNEGDTVYTQMMTTEAWG